MGQNAIKLGLLIFLVLFLSACVNGEWRICNPQYSDPFNRLLCFRF